jgi:hypothetical protein
VRTLQLHQPHAVTVHSSGSRKILPITSCGPRPECRDSILANLEQARELVNQCKTASEAKEVIDAAVAAKVYACRQRVSKDIINSATALEIDARTRLGEILERSDRNPGTAGHLIGPGRGNENGGIVVEPPFGIVEVFPLRPPSTPGSFPRISTHECRHRNFQLDAGLRKVSRS